MNPSAAIAVSLALLIVGVVFFPAPLEEIHIPGGVLAHLGILNITNTLLATWVTMLALVGLFYTATAGFNQQRMSIIPRGVQNLVEMLIEALLDFVNGVAGPANARKFLPLIVTIFLFVLGNAWLGLLPGYLTVGVIKAPEHGEPVHHFTNWSIGGLSIGVIPLGSSAAHEPEPAHAAEIAPSYSSVPPSEKGEDFTGVFVPVLRAANTDLNTTLGLALVAMFSIEMWGLQALGVGYLGKFFNFSGPIAFFVGLLELVSEFARIISFTFRLFGNMFAGEVLLGVITFLVPWVLVLPFFGLELFVGFVQALVFAGLTLVFATMAVTAHAEHEEHGDGEAGHPVEAHGAAHH